MHARSRFFYRKLALLTIAAALAELTPARSPEDATVSYTLVKTDLTANEPVYLKVVVNNEMAEGLVADLTFNTNGFGGFRGKITRPDGRAEEAPKPSP